MWFEEMCQQRDTLSYLASVPLDDIQGARAPFLQINGDETYRALSSCFRYESSRPSLNFTPNLWPYTAEYDSIQDCQLPPCPNGSYPNFWVSPLVDLFGEDGNACASVNTCQPVPEDANSTYNLLKTNFLNHYNGQRAPFGLYSAWDFVDLPERLEGYLKFLDEILALGDTYVVSISKGLDFAQTPQPLAGVDNIPSWKPRDPPFDDCDFPFVCTYTGTQLPDGFWGERRMNACSPCPPSYPWVRNNLGQNKAT